MHALDHAWKGRTTGEQLMDGDALIDSAVRLMEAEVRSSLSLFRIRIYHDTGDGSLNQTELTGSTGRPVMTLFSFLVPHSRGRLRLRLERLQRPAGSHQSRDRGRAAGQHPIIVVVFCLHGWLGDRRRGVAAKRGHYVQTMIDTMIMTCTWWIGAGRTCQSGTLVSKLSTMYSYV
jgi:hypothetical protein